MSSVNKVDQIVDLLGKPIDAGIKPLVQVLIDSGYRTKSSCEGHFNWGRGYPYVDLPSDQDLTRLQEGVEEYGLCCGYPWELNDSHYIRRGVRAIELRPLITDYVDVLESRRGEIPLLVMPALLVRKYLLRNPVMEEVKPDLTELIKQQGSIERITNFLSSWFKI